MNLFFEEDGSFKAGTVLSQAGNAYQVQLPTGRRTKIKASHSFFEFEQPAPADLVTRAQAMVPDSIPPSCGRLRPRVSSRTRTLPLTTGAARPALLKRLPFSGRFMAIPSTSTERAAAATAAPPRTSFRRHSRHLRRSAVWRSNARPGRPRWWRERFPTSSAATP